MKRRFLAFLLTVLMLGGCARNTGINDAISGVLSGTSGEEQQEVTPPENTDGVENSEIAFFGPYAVERVVDGDTIVVAIEGESVKVRMIGVDTPESVHADESKNSEEGKIASEWTKTLLTDAKVYLEFDVDREDDYGRVLAYVYLEDKMTMVNRLLIEEGMARTMTIQPNSKYADAFYVSQIAARIARTGFWGTGAFE